MTHNFIVRARDQMHAVWKFCLSICKRDWVLSDYPVVIRANETDPNYIGTRLKQHRYTALIVNWGLAGLGDSEKEALIALDKSFAAAKIERARTHVALPRPGAHVPIQFASQERVNRHPELAEDFVHRVLGLDWAWISDESSLWDFHAGENNDELISKIKEVYGVDVSDISSARLSEIFERIAVEQQSA